MTEDVCAAIAGLKRDQVVETVRRRVEEGEDPKRILDECRRGMEVVGERYERGDYFLAELLLAGEIFKEVTVALEPHIAREHMPELSGKVVLATLRGDIHDLGKNIFAVLLKSQGFEVHDMGVDVDPSTAVDKVKEVGPDFVGFSVLMTSGFGSVKDAAELLKREGLRDKLKLMIGGGVTNAIVKEFVGADFQTVDAAEGVRYCIKGEVAYRRKR
jgi:methanogenic corrinoid protein MtbC1